MSTPVKWVPDQNEPGEPYLPSLTEAAGEMCKVSEADQREILGLIDAADEALQEHPDRIPNPNHTNHHADGLYGRELSTPAGSVFTTKIHNRQHFLFVMKGSCSVLDVQTGIRYVEAPAMIVTEPGTYRIVRVHTDSIWITVHATELTDVDEILDEILTDHVGAFSRLLEHK